MAMLAKFSSPKYMSLNQCQSQLALEAPKQAGFDQVLPQLLRNIFDGVELQLIELFKSRETELQEDIRRLSHREGELQAEIAKLQQDQDAKVIKLQQDQDAKVIKLQQDQDALRAENQQLRKLSETGPNLTDWGGSQPAVVIDEHLVATKTLGISRLIQHFDRSSKASGATSTSTTTTTSANATPRVLSRSGTFGYSGGRHKKIGMGAGNRSCRYEPMPPDDIHSQQGAHSAQMGACKFAHRCDMPGLDSSSCGGTPSTSRPPSRSASCTRRPGGVSYNKIRSMPTPTGCFHGSVHDGHAGDSSAAGFGGSAGASTDCPPSGEKGYNFDSVGLQRDPDDVNNMRKAPLRLPMGSGGGVAYGSLQALKHQVFQKHIGESWGDLSSSDDDDDDDAKRRLRVSALPRKGRAPGGSGGAVWEPSPLAGPMRRRLDPAVLRDLVDCAQEVVDRSFGSGVYFMSGCKPSLSKPGPVLEKRETNKLQASGRSASCGPEGFTIVSI